MLAASLTAQIHFLFPPPPSEAHPVFFPQNVLTAGVLTAQQKDDVRSREGTFGQRCTHFVFSALVFCWLFTRFQNAAFRQTRRLLSLPREPRQLRNFLLRPEGELNLSPCAPNSSLYFKYLQCDVSLYFYQRLTVKPEGWPLKSEITIRGLVWRLVTLVNYNISEHISGTFHIMPFIGCEYF